MGLNDYLGRLRIIANDKSSRKNAFTIGKEVISTALATKKVPFYYITKFLYRKESGHYKKLSKHGRRSAG